MTGKSRLRQLASIGAAIALATVFSTLLGACTGEHPNTTFTPNSEYGRDIDFIWDRLLLLGTIVFILTEAALLFIVFKYRHNDKRGVPPQTHGNTKLEILWTLIPAVILVFIAVPTVRTIFKTQAAVVPNALQVEVIGHQWWWEFRYPEYGVVTANEVYLPKGRTVNFALKTADVLHSFWAPQLGGKRDLIANRTNYIWLTPDSTMKTAVWNGFCTEYCGSSHANMRFRVVTVEPADFERWTAHQKSPAMFNSMAMPGAVGATVASAPYIFPAENIPAYTIPKTPTPKGLTWNESLVGDPARGEKTYSSSSCIGCHTVTGNPMSVGKIGPNLTHVGSRITIAAGLYPNDRKHLALWIKNARRMKPGSIMNTLGKGEHDPIMKNTVTVGGLDDQQIADIVAYLQSLK